MFAQLFPDSISTSTTPPARPRTTRAAIFPILDAARANAVAGIRSLLSEEAKTGEINFRGRVEIADEKGVILLTISFPEAIRITR